MMDYIEPQEYSGQPQFEEDHHAKVVVAFPHSAWLLLCGALVMITHAGCRMLETGCSRAKSASNMLMGNLVKACADALAAQKAARKAAEERAATDAADAARKAE